MCGFNQSKLCDRNVIHNVGGCDQTCFCIQCNDNIVGSQVAHDKSEGTFKVNSVDKSTSADKEYAKNTHIDFKYSQVTVIDNYRHIQTTGVNLVQCSHRNTSTKVPVNNANLGVGFVCNTNNINVGCEEMKYNCVADGYNILHAAGADGGLEHHNVGCNCVLGLYDVDLQ